MELTIQPRLQGILKKQSITIGKNYLSSGAMFDVEFH